MKQFLILLLLIFFLTLTNAYYQMKTVQLEAREAELVNEMMSIHLRMAVLERYLRHLQTPTPLVYPPYWFDVQRAPLLRPAVLYAPHLHPYPRYMVRVVL